MKLRNFLFIMFFEIKEVIFKFFDEFFDFFVFSLLLLVMI